MKFLTAVLFSVLLFAGCGYKAATVYSKQVLGDRVFVLVSMLRSDPENTVLVKDSVNEAIMAKFKSKLSSEADANSKMFVKVVSVSMSPLEYDKNGYVVLYRMNVSLETKVIAAFGERIIRSEGSHDFSIEPNTAVSDAKRFEAIKYGASKAVDMLMSQIAVSGVKSGAGANSGKSH